MIDLKKTFNVKVIPHAKQKKVIVENGIIKVYINVAPENGKANIVVVDLLAQYFNVPKASILILHGLTSRNKIISIG